MSKDPEAKKVRFVEEVQIKTFDPDSPILDKPLIEPVPDYDPEIPEPDYELTVGKPTFVNKPEVKNQAREVGVIQGRVVNIYDQQGHLKKDQLVITEREMIGERDKSKKKS